MLGEAVLRLENRRVGEVVIHVRDPAIRAVVEPSVDADRPVDAMNHPRIVRAKRRTVVKSKLNELKRQAGVCAESRSSSISIPRASSSRVKCAKELMSAPRRRRREVVEQSEIGSPPTRGDPVHLDTCRADELRPARRTARGTRARLHSDLASPRQRWLARRLALRARTCSIRFATAPTSAHARGRPRDCAQEHSVPLVTSTRPAPAPSPLPTLRSTGSRSVGPRPRAIPDRWRGAVRARSRSAQGLLRGVRARGRSAQRHPSFEPEPATSRSSGSPQPVSCAVAPTGGSRVSSSDGTRRGGTARHEGSWAHSLHPPEPGRGTRSARSPCRSRRWSTSSRERSSRSGGAIVS